VLMRGWSVMAHSRKSDNSPVQFNISPPKALGHNSPIYSNISQVTVCEAIA
jgi:hypothetical protein